MTRSRGKQSEDYSYTDEDRETLRRAVKDRPFAMEMFGRVEHRNKRGEIAPMVLFPAQIAVDRLIEQIRALNIARQIDTTPEGSRISDQIKLARRDEAGWLRKRIARIGELSAGEVLAIGKRAGLEITDGPVKIVIGKSRRGGLSSYLNMLMVLLCNFNRGVRCIGMAHKGDNAELIFRYTRTFTARWPVELLHFKQTLTSETKTAYEWEGGSRMRIQTAGGDGSGRGDQADVYHFSECAFYPDYGEVADTVAAAPGHAWIFEESTANGPQGGYWERFQSAKDFDTVVDAIETENAAELDRQSWNGFFRFFFSWLDDPAFAEHVEPWEREHLEGSLDDYEQLLVRERGATLEQVKFRRVKMGELGDRDLRGLTAEQFWFQEYPSTPEEMFQSSGLKVFDAARIVEMEHAGRNKAPAAHIRLLEPPHPPRSVRPFQANLTVWKPPEPGRLYAIGADTGKGLAHGDWSVAVVLDRHDGTVAEEAATWRGKLEPAAFGQMLVTLAEFYNQAFLVPEVNDAGYSTCKEIVDLGYPWIYHRRPVDLVRDTYDDVNMFRFGWLAMGPSKSVAIYSLQRGLKEKLLTIYSADVLRELKIYENRDGRLTAPRSENDDCVIALALAWEGHTTYAPKVDPRRLQQQKNRHRVSKNTAEVWEAVKRLNAKSAAEARRLGILSPDSIPREYDR